MKRKKIPDGSILTAVRSWKF